MHDVLSAYEDDDVARARAPLVPARTRVLVWRRRERVFFRAPETLEADALEQVISGASFGSLCAHLARHRGDEPAASLAAAFLARWLDDGLLVGTPADSPAPRPPQRAGCGPGHQADTARADVS